MEIYTIFNNLTFTKCDILIEKWYYTTLWALLFTCHYEYLRTFEKIIFLQILKLSFHVWIQGQHVIDTLQSMWIWIESLCLWIFKITVFKNHQLICYGPSCSNRISMIHRKIKISKKCYLSDNNLVFKYFMRSNRIKGSNCWLKAPEQPACIALVKFVSVGFMDLSQVFNWSKE